MTMGIIEDVCELASPEHGWIVVTLRQDLLSFQTCIDLEQVVCLKPLSGESAMVILWRWKTSKKQNQVSDDNILVDLESHGDEYQAVRKLLVVLGLNGLGKLRVQLKYYIRRLFGAV